MSSIGDVLCTHMSGLRETSSNLNIALRNAIGEGCVVCAKGLFTLHAHETMIELCAPGTVIRYSLDGEELSRTYKHATTIAEAKEYWISAIAAKRQELTVGSEIELAAFYSALAASIY